MKEIIIKTNGKEFTANAPYLNSFIKKAKSLGGKWSGNCWTFDIRNKEEVEKVLTEVYGYDKDSQFKDKKTILLDVKECKTYQDKSWKRDDGEVDLGEEDSLKIAGRSLAWRPGRDRDVVFADGVVLVQGGFKESAGSARYPELGFINGTILKVYDVPSGVIKWLDRNEVPYKVIETPVKDADLEIERLKEIERQLVEMLENVRQCLKEKGTE